MSRGNQLFEDLKGSVETLSPTQRTVAKFILGNYQRVAFTTIRELARLAGTSEATIVRFVKVLGFAGYPAFQKEVRRLVRKDLKGQERFSLVGQPEERNVLSSFLGKELENLSFLDKTFDEKRFQEAVAALKEATEVFVVGSRSTASLAYHLWFGLAKIGIESRRFTCVDTETYDEVSRMGPGGLVIILGFPRYLRELVELLDFVKSRHLTTLTVTDSPFSPLLGDVSLFSPAESVSFMAFHSAPMVLINALLEAASQSNRETTVAALDRFEKVADIRGYFVKP